MKRLAFGEKLPVDIPVAVTIGVFDGVHLGHRRVLTQTVDTARKLGAAAMAISFSRNPKASAARGCLISPRLLEEELINVGMDYHCVIDFSDEMSRISGVEFITALSSCFRVSAMLVGSDFRCGNPGNSLGVEEIKKTLERPEVGASVVVVDPLTDSQGQVISSSLVRAMLQKGEVARCAALLGRPYCLDCRGVPFSFRAGRLLTQAGSFCEILPCEGDYEALAVAEDGSSLEVELSVVGSCLALQLPEPVELDRIFFIEGVIR